MLPNAYALGNCLITGNLSICSGGQEVRKGFLKKVSSVALALTMVVGSINIVPAASHASNGANVASNITWNYFSIIPADGKESSLDKLHNGHVDGEDGKKVKYCWYHALTHIRTEDYPNGQVPLGDFATQGWVAPGATASKAQFWAANTGWDGQYNERDGSLVGDNPYGLRFYTSNIPVEKGRTYTVSFKYRSTLKGKKTIYEKDEYGDYKYDENGERIPVLDENNDPIQEDNYIKHIGFNVINPANNNGLDLTSYSGCTSGGSIEADSSVEGEKTVKVTVKVPKTYAGNAICVQFTAGSYITTYPDETAMKGSLFVDDFKVTAGNQYIVKYICGNQSYTEHVNAGEKASGHQFAVKGKTFSAYKVGSSKYNLSTPVKGNLNITCVYTATKKPGKAKVTFKAAKKSAKLRFKKLSNAKGYEIKYANNSKMKKAKTKTTTKSSIAIKKLKSGKKTYFRVRAYNLDSAGKKVYSKKVVKKSIVIK